MKNHEIVPNKEMQHMGFVAMLFLIIFFSAGGYYVSINDNINQTGANLHSGANVHEFIPRQLSKKSKLNKLKFESFFLKSKYNKLGTSQLEYDFVTGEYLSSETQAAWYFWSGGLNKAPTLSNSKSF